MRRFGLIGRTLKHSFSKTYFTKKFTDEGIAGCSYENFELSSIRALPSLLESENPEGLNVTIPYKEAVIAFLDRQDETVQQIGACNCIRVRNGSLTGFNTDATAFSQSLQQHLKPHHKRALVLGSGGASRAIRFALEEMGIGYLLVSRFRKGNVIDYDDLSDTLVKDHPLIINTTPLGMYPDNGSSPPLPYNAIRPSHLLFDLVYNPERTSFMTEGEKRGAQVVNGYEMLVLQAEESWRIWNGREKL